MLLQQEAIDRAVAALELAEKLETEEDLEAADYLVSKARAYIELSEKLPTFEKEVR